MKLGMKNACARDAVVVWGEACRERIRIRIRKIKKQEIAHLPNVGSEIGKKVSKGAVVGADDELHKDAAQYTPQPSELETITKLS